MEVKLLFLSAVLLSSALLTLGDPLYVLSAPNLLRVGSSENVFVEAQDYSGAPLNVRITVKNFPAKNVEMVQKTVTLTGTKFQILTDIEIPGDRNFFSDNEKKQYVYLQAHFPSVTLEKVVMVSFQSGYLFVQTDKPIYTPGSNVQYRIFSMTPNLKPLSKPGITVDIMNPQGITVASDTVFAVKGVKSSIYNIPEVTSLGMWKVVTRYANTPQKTFTAEFEVKEYVLPTFEVKLTPSSSFYYVGDKKKENDEEDSLTVDIEAKYLFGKKMDGNAFVVFGVMDGAAKTSIVNSLQKVQVVNGVGTAELTREMITKTFKNIKDLVGKSIYVSVNLLTESGSEMVEAEKRGIQIVTSPYTIHYKRTSQFFKPGMPLGVSVYVTNPDETPAEDVEVEVLVDGKGGVSGRTRSNGIAKVTVNTQAGASTLKITAKTKDPGLTGDQQAWKTMTAQAYETKRDSKNYLHINIESAEFEIGDQMTVYLNTGQSPGVKTQDYTYMILSKGQIVLAERFKRQGQTLVSLSLTVTKDMVPSFRFVAYYHVGSDEVVSDSVWVDVKDTCMGKLKLEVKEKQKFYETGNDVNLQISGDHGARVGLVVVDKAVQVLNKNRLTQTKIWDAIEKHDTGCTGGGGRDSMGVFSDAGLMFESNTAGGTNTRTVPECPSPPKRKRRSGSLQTITTTLAGQYSEKIRPCCYDGMSNNRIGYTCERRASYVIDGEECVKAFLHCCKEVKNHKEKETEEEELILARSDEEEGDYADYDDITSRTQFPESWLWEEFDLCDKCSKPSKDKLIYLKDSITTWQVLAISLSPTHGLCVAEPEEIIVFKSFFIDLKVPYSAVRGEQLEIKAIIHNYTPKHLKKVRVEFLETAGVCSAASKKGIYRTTVNVDKDSSVAVSFVIVPMTLESQHVEVKASISDYEDGVRKTLKVVSEGVLSKYRSEKLELNPAKKGEKPLVLRSGIPADQVPGTPINSYITVTGEEISQSIEQAINGSFMGELIIQPHGCGEQNMAKMTLPVVATHYLDNTNQWEYVGIDRRKVAIDHIKTGYDGQLKFRKPDGSYAIWIYTPSSTWLTAYVAKVFARASQLIAIEENVICSALKWLVMHKQLPDGSFKEEKPVYDKSIMGGIEGQNTYVTLTAFVLIAMQEGKEICGGAVGSLHESMRKAVVFLKDQFPKLTNPYAVALTSYALANAESLDKAILMKHSTKGDDGRFWNVPGRHYHSIEATAYAVLALVKAKDYEKAGEAVQWLAKQKSSHGGYDTTQVTIMVFQAVAEYHAQVQDLNNFDLNVELVVPGRRKTDRWTIQRSNVHLTRSGNVDMNKDFTVIAKGTGSAILSVLTLYYARPSEKKSDCTFFDLSVKLDKIPETKPGTNGTYNFILDFFYKNKTNDATMTILDIGLPTGFDIDEADLKQLSTGKERYIQKYEKNKVLSERGSLIIYLDKVSHQVSERLVFRMHKTFNVGLLQPASVTIYEYYSPDARCKKYYHPEREDSALYRLCKGELCVCAEESCSYQKKNQVEESKRMIKACEPNLDYIYKAKLVKMDLKQDSDIYHMKVEKTVKEGTDPDVEGKVKSFLARPSCRASLGLVEGKSYLIMGNSVDLPTLGGSLQYIIGEQTWIEYWPTSDESKSAEHRERYIGMTAVENMFTTGGCLT
ncbi:complement C3-like [Danio aesculapii]|uniref:complement C3-like n=1 Tax=Danio aesculapii TaxID=1142201 RepID=UPI0024C0E236|nr:complement C3-like [Danio aesculapii]